MWEGRISCYSSTIPEKSFKAEFVGVDLSQSFLSEAKKFVDHAILASIDHLPFRDRVFDAVFCIEVIEHLPKQSGYELLKEMERVSKRLVVLTTPSHFLPELHVDTFRNKGLMTHKSLWKPDDFKRQGYSVEGLQPAGEFIPPWLAKKIPYLACSILAYKALQS